MWGRDRVAPGANVACLSKQDGRIAVQQYNIDPSIALHHRCRGDGKGVTHNRVSNVGWDCESARRVLSVVSMRAGSSASMRLWSAMVLWVGLRARVECCVARGQLSKRSKNAKRDTQLGADVSRAGVGVFSRAPKVDVKVRTGTPLGELTLTVSVKCDVK